MAALRGTVTIDLDGTLARSGERVSDLIRKNHPDSANEIRMYAHVWENPRLIEPFSRGISDVLDRMAESWKLALLTSSSGSRARVCEFLEMHSLRFDRLIFSPLHGKFDIIVSDPRIKIHFDDDPNLAFAVARSGRKAIIPDGPWNRGIECYGNPQRMMDWSEALSLIGSGQRPA